MLRIEKQEGWTFGGRAGEAISQPQVIIARIRTLNTRCFLLLIVQHDLNVEDRNNINLRFTREAITQPIETLTFNPIIRSFFNKVGGNF